MNSHSGIPGNLPMMWEATGPATGVPATGCPRTSMEDSHVMLATDQYGLFGVFDGHGQLLVPQLAVLTVIFVFERISLNDDRMSMNAGEKLRF